jgi:alginate O-acetyltransferase complex protein AlgI
LLQAACYVLTFLVCVVVLATVRSRGMRRAVLLIASLGLYLTWTPWFAAVLLTSAVMNFAVGSWLRRRISWVPLSVGILLNLTILGVFKYLPEFLFRGPFASSQIFANLVLPLGISFWTFQALSYLFDLYREEDLDPTFAEFLLYMSFFPITISGPVCRMPEMLPQFRSETKTPSSEIGEGLRRIAIGVLMMQFAKLLGRGILGGDGIITGFDHTTQWSGSDVWCLAFGYGLQLFFDFAGYTHIAVGAAKALGISVPENFDRPFASTTPSVFWTRWHMSLSFWIRDYVFLPLAISRRETWWRNFALVVSMILFGIWHRATVLFFIWGLYQGVLLVAHRQVQQMERKFEWDPPALWTPLSWIVTISLISLGWIFFRGNSLSQARQMLTAIATLGGYGSHFLSSSLYLLVAVLATGYAVVVGVGTVLDRQSAERRDSSIKSPGIIFVLARRRWFWILPLYTLTLLLVLMITMTQDGGAAQFIYRRF